MSSATSEKEIWHSMHIVLVVMTDIWDICQGETSKMNLKIKFGSERNKRTEYISVSGN